MIFVIKNCPPLALLQKILWVLVGEVGELQIEQCKLLLNSLASKMENLGFAKIRGHPFWPSEISRDVGGRLLVTFLGSNKTGTISKKKLRKEWLPWQRSFLLLGT